MRIRSSRYLTGTPFICSRLMSRCLTTSTFWGSLEDESLPVQINGTSFNRPTYFRTPTWGSKAWVLVALSLSLFYLQRNIGRELQGLGTSDCKPEPIQVL